MPKPRAPFSAVLDAVREHTSMLLGTTIGYSTEDWAAPTDLVGWTRSHVAAHLVEGARGMIRVIQGHHAGAPVHMYGSEAERWHAVELGALGTGLELQIGLDTSASELQSELPALEGDDQRLELRTGYVIPASSIPLARLSEVVLHHMDLGWRLGVEDLAPDIAVALLEFQVWRLGALPDIPPTRLIADEGFEDIVGPDGVRETLRGPAVDLIAWLSRGVESDRLTRES
ncbi:MAG: maleylpyruvate isomerase family mycothiol-dependent enzyme [Arachnia sp.]